MQFVTPSTFRFITGESYGTRHCLRCEKLVCLPFLQEGTNICNLLPYEVILQKPPHLSDVLSWSGSGSHCSWSQSWLTLQVPKIPTEICFLLLCPSYTWKTLRQICRLTSLIPLERFLSFFLITNLIGYNRHYNCDCHRFSFAVLYFIVLISEPLKMRVQLCFLIEWI